MLALGLMSGTSMDGIDLALLDTDGRDRLQFGPTAFTPYAEADRALLRRALADAASLSDRDARPGALAEAETRITALHAAAVREFLAAHPAEARRLELIGFHGQTVLHRPERRLTVQIGDGARLARDTGVDVVADLRAADVAMGGQGAPLVPAFHRALAAASGLALPAAVLNLGGVGNITFLPDAGDPLAFDTGPANALVDDLMLERTGAAFDRDGATAAAGRIHPGIVADLMRHPYFAAPPPKSLDRNAWSRAPVAPLSTADAAATLTDFTAASVARALAHLPAAPGVLVVCGGGARNPTLMDLLAARLPCRVLAAAALGWDGDAVEAQAFAYLAVRSRLGLPITFPGTTGVAAPATGGVAFGGRV
ncbi:anhydro-N-acetylmuramic acid kinase [Lichenibacterium minor]|uniref:Anhydro-N-acetylmuramic acid kinase n=1 Tax=Lichenibacterium minor TaxID=2316528 RepID=A0A4Q2U749_9HYPH|nr:anhydro-N-acetylmuramic acid kinase [Lichenibacterium minor]RYC31718.1 anhydro-N-acetylmuramic acid kinase [Lichenibacterium minor]